MERSYDLNGKVVVKFDPDSDSFANRLRTSVHELDRLQRNHYEGGADHFLQTVRDMERILDSLFDVPICEPLFGGIRPGALADGSPLWRNLLCAVMAEVGDNSRLLTSMKGGK